MLIVFKFRNSPLDNYDTVKKFIENVMEQPMMTKLLTKARESNSTILNIVQLRWRRTSSMLRIGSIENGNQEKVSMLRESELSSSILVPSSTSRTIRKYNLALQDNVLLPEGFTEFIYHVGNGKELRSIVNHGLIPGGVSLKTGRQAVFFIIVNSMDNQDAMGETLCDLSRARIAPYKNTWKRFQNTVFWRNLKLAQQRGLQFYQTRSNAVIFYDTLPVELFEKAICMKTKDQLFVILRPRVVLWANSQCGSQDLLVQEARSFLESQQDAESYGETRSNTADYRILGMSISTVNLQDARRQK